MYTHHATPDICRVEYSMHVADQRLFKIYTMVFTTQPPWPVSFLNLNDDSIYYVNTVSDKRKLNIIR